MYYIYIYHMCIYICVYMYIISVYTISIDVSYYYI